jgi:hypothetical protein
MLRNPVIKLRSQQLAFGSVNCQHVSFLSMIMFLCSGQHQKLPESNIKKSALFQFKRPVMTKGCACHMPWWQMTPADSKRRHPTLNGNIFTSLNQAQQNFLLYMGCKCNSLMITCQTIDDMMENCPLSLEVLVNLSCFEKTNMNCSQEDDHIVHSKEGLECFSKEQKVKDFSGIEVSETVRILIMDRPHTL